MPQKMGVTFKRMFQNHFLDVFISDNILDNQGHPFLSPLQEQTYFSLLSHIQNVRFGGYVLK